MPAASCVVDKIAATHAVVGPAAAAAPEPTTVADVGPADPSGDGDGGSEVRGGS